MEIGPGETGDLNCHVKSEAKGGIEGAQYGKGWDSREGKWGPLRNPTKKLERAISV